jgi:putative aldouronate transport system substrate-binding protein
VKAEHEYLTKVMPTGVTDPTAGLYSATASTKGATAGTNLLNAQGDIIQGRRKLSDWDNLVRTWRQQAGDKMRGEYEKAYAGLHSGH